jgi:hypothetical protein
MGKGIITRLGRRGRVHDWMREGGDFNNGMEEVVICYTVLYSIPHIYTGYLSACIFVSYSLSNVDVPAEERQKDFCAMSPRSTCFYTYINLNEAFTPTGPDTGTGYVRAQLSVKENNSIIINTPAQAIDQSINK